MEVSGPDLRARGVRGGARALWRAGFVKTLAGLQSAGRGRRCIYR